MQFGDNIIQPSYRNSEFRHSKSVGWIGSTKVKVKVVNAGISVCLASLAGVS